MEIKHSKPNLTISIIHINIRSIKKHLDELEALILSLESPPDIICLTETWLTDNDKNESWLISGYNQCCRKKRKALGGGVMIQIRNTCCILNQIEMPFDEGINATISKSYFKFSVGVVHNKPKANKMLFVEKLDNYLDKNKSMDQPMILCGDFNIDIIQNNLLTQIYLKAISSNGYEISSNEPTRVTENTQTCLDHFIFQYIPLPVLNVLKYETISDHYPILLEWKLKRENCHDEIPYRDTSFLKTPLTVSKILQNLHRVSAWRAVPLKRKKNIQKTRPVWFTNRLANLRNKRNIAHRKCKINLDNADYLTKFKLLRSQFEKEVEQSKKELYWNKFKNCIRDSRQTCK